jgi:leader peptidase (prepilin peptidase)/N-methyltransferase
MTFAYAAFIGLGLLIGSFLNVCIYRVPIGKSIVFPPSSCPECGSHIKPWHNIPVISYIFLGGRCASCGAGISPVYPVVETLNALLYAAALYRFGYGLRGLVVMALMSAFVVVTFIDLKHQIIPDGITLPGIIIGFALGPAAFGTGMLDSALGVVAGGGLLMFASMVGSVVLGKESMGGGDIKLMAMVGGFVGWKMVLVSIFIGSVIGSAVGVPLIAFKVIKRDTLIPFGPFLVAGSAIVIFFGPEIFAWYGGRALLPV